MIHVATFVLPDCRYTYWRSRDWTRSFMFIVENGKLFSQDGKEISAMDLVELFQNEESRSDVRLRSPWQD